MSTVGGGDVAVLGDVAVTTCSLGVLADVGGLVATGGHVLVEELHVPTAGQTAGEVVVAGPTAS